MAKCLIWASIPIWVATTLTAKSKGGKPPSFLALGVHKMFTNKGRFVHNWSPRRCGPGRRDFMNKL